MLVRNEDRREFARARAKRAHSLERFTAGDAGIDQNARCAAGNHGTVAPAAARQQRDGNPHVTAAYPGPLWNGSTFLVIRDLWVGSSHSQLSALSSQLSAEKQELNLESVKRQLNFAGDCERTHCGVFLRADS